MTTEALRGAEAVGQSLWIDYLHRKAVEDGQLQAQITSGGITGLTSNPAIFEKAISGDALYSERIGKLLAGKGRSSAALYEEISVDDIKAATKLLRPVYDRTKGRDGFASLEVSPYLAHDTAGTIAEAHRLWAAVGQPNVMIKVPATTEGIPAIKQLISDGINVNVTLLFAVEVYRKVAEAYISGLEALAAKGGSVANIASVASFFVSRVDNKIDDILGKKPDGKALLGKAGVANAKCAYIAFTEISESARWKALVAKGARTQRLLWASTSVKNPAYPELLYVEELMGPDTVDTLPPVTYEAFKVKGKAENRLGTGLDSAKATMAALAAAGVSYEKVTTELTNEGVVLFQEAFDKLMSSVEKRRVEFLGKKLNSFVAALPGPLGESVNNAKKDWAAKGKVRQLWHKDKQLWTGADEDRWLGWLDAVAAGRKLTPALTEFAAGVKKDGFTHVLLLGMGGSSLCPDVFSKVFGKQQGFPELHVVDSTSPDQIQAVEAKVDLKTTLVIVASKSGSTLEPNILRDYFAHRLTEVVGNGASRHLVAITDPGSALDKYAKEHRYRAVFSGEPSIGGRFSALSPFGLVPFAAMGLDVTRFLDEVELMADACGALVPPSDNPGVQLGLILGEAAKIGRDKVTLVAGKGFEALGGWLEQLLAESTGKQGKGLIPVDGEQLGAPETYGKDRVFAYIHGRSAQADFDSKLTALEKAGHPVVRIGLDEALQVGQEFFRWEIATAVAGSVLSLNPFDQPDVEAAKNVTRDLAAEYEKTKKVKTETPRAKDGNLQFFGTPAGTENATKVGEILKSFVASAKQGNYFGILGFIEMNQDTQTAFAQLRQVLRDKTHMATVVGFGPRFLHSTGQAYKGGPKTGLFLQVTADPKKDLQVPEKAYTFGLIQSFQAAGDLAVLKERGQRTLHVHIVGDVKAGLTALTELVKKSI